MAKKIASNGNAVKLDVVVSTACRDLGRPRFSPAPPKFGGRLEAMAGALAPNGKKLLSTSFGNSADNLAMQNYDASLLSSVITPELTGTKVQLRMVQDEITKSGLWEPLMPMTQLVRKVHQECLSNSDPFSLIDAYKTYIKNMETDLDDAYHTSEEGKTVYQPKLDVGKEKRAAKYRQMMDGFSNWTNKLDALESIVKGASNGEELTLILCAPVGFIVPLLKRLSKLNLTSAIKQVWGDMLTLNPKDNLVECHGTISRSGIG